MFEVEALSAGVGSFRLENIFLSLNEGECQAVLGPSGSGKSTLLSAILGATPVTSGHIRLGDDEITYWPMEQRRLGYVPQHLGLFPHLSVRDNLRYSARARKLARNDFEPLLDKLVEITNIGKLLNRQIGTLSGGERQRVALVRALAANPRLVLLDEPFTALNETLRKELWWLVKELQRERGLSALLVTHDLTEAYFLADKITVLINGRQEQSDNKTTIYQHPANLAVARFLGIKNLFPATVVKSSEEGIEADCPALAHSFRLQGHAPVGTAIRVGIRPENVMVCDEDHPPCPNDCVLSGTIRLIDMGVNVAMHFHSPQLSSIIEIIAPRRLVNRFRIANDSPRLTIALPSSAMFWVRDE
ncbi:MAG TPA: ABC transporter ATP-binding protein [Chlorobaculum sp.]|uniref:ABC transporter, ATP-binding protein n=1 Tax=Chlorobaculum tepidum (strain ATCC 49652 / DSM 12025 / NBRC 103806 / TLS) TaxID=194439 RepID=Q8KEM0_CHLTE|nr:ABC transporter ATP-binding protein [Chlorobaculum tepidum]AAM71906.1 ABC transporter, ATP-binding protein [Chlorobaculum tepidum TLS]HBU22808.1 ABC transporter ATP-binding protein [Chlorobaculum sp.]